MTWNQIYFKTHFQINRSNSLILKLKKLKNQKIKTGSKSGTNPKNWKMSKCSCGYRCKTYKCKTCSFWLSDLRMQIIRIISTGLLSTETKHWATFDLSVRVLKYSIVHNLSKISCKRFKFYFLNLFNKVFDKLPWIKKVYSFKLFNKIYYLFKIK